MRHDRRETVILGVMGEHGEYPVPEVSVWSDGRSAHTLARLIDLMGASVNPIGIGGPRPSELKPLAEAADAQASDDLRKLIVDHPSAYLLLATMEQVGPGELAMAAQQHTTILALEPPAADLQTLASLRQRPRSRAGATATCPLDSIVHVPAFLASPGFLSAAEPYDVLGADRVVQIASLGGRGEGSLFARLYDLWHTVLELVAMPVSIDASLIDPSGQVPDDLRDIAGRVAGHARVAEGGAVAFLAADTASAAGRSMHVLGDGGRLRVDDASYELRDGEGQLLDEQPVAGVADFVELIAQQWGRLLDGRTAVPGQGEHHAAALACCLATLLSARTAEPENPRKLLELNR